MNDRRASHSSTIRTGALGRLALWAILLAVLGFARLPLARAGSPYELAIGVGGAGAGSIAMQVQANPHSDYLNNPDSCARCHRLHTGKGNKLIFSPATGNAFCYVCHDGTGASAAPPVSTHSNVDYSGGSEAAFTLLCVQCHNPHGNPNNLYAIRDYAVVVPGTNPVTSGPVVFTATTGANSYDDGSSSPASRVCVTCHHDPNNPGYPMTNHVGGTNHLGGYNFAGQDCTTCHPHSADGDRYTEDGFMPAGGCTGCHSIPQDNGDGVPVGGRRAIVPEFSNASHHVATAVEDADCQVCHDTANHKQGQVELLNVDTGATIVYTGPAALEPFCLACHDSDGAAGAAPFNDGLMPPVVDQALWAAASHQGSGSATCGDCHDNGHGSNKQGLLSPWNAAPDGDPDDPLRQEERFCYQCHDGGVAATNIQGEFGQSSHHDVALTDQNGNGARVECINCHNPHMDNAANQNASPDDWYQQWAGRRVDFCLACHDGSPPVVTGGPAPAVLIPATYSGTGYDKSAFPGSVHDSTLSAWGCSHCHDEHGSNNISTLLANYTIADNTQYNYGDGNYALCFTCHIEADIVRDNGGNKANNAFEDRHDKHVRGEDAPCIHCHDPHNPYDPGEEGLINMLFAVTQMDVTILNGYDQSTTFQISGNTGYCYLGCHNENHDPLDYNRNDNQASTTTCTACHPGGPPPPTSMDSAGPVNEGAPAPQPSPTPGPSP